MQDIEKLQVEVQKVVDESKHSNSKKDKDKDAEGKEEVKREDAGEEQSEIATTKFMEKIEHLQDRWDAISQILEAQSQRVSLLTATQLHRGFLCAIVS